MEYGVIGTLIAVVIVTSLLSIGHSVNNMLSANTLVAAVSH